MLPTPLAVRVTDGSGRPVPDVKIRWSALDHGAMTAAPSPSVTDGSGIAMVYRTLSSNAGTHTTTATIDGVADALVRFTSIAQIQGATQMALHPVSSGNSQTDTVLTTLAPYRVVVRDHNNAPVAGVVVSWTGGGSSSGGGSLSSATSTTDASGVAEVRHTLAKGSGRYVVQASVAGLLGSPVSFEATANPGKPTGIAKPTGDEVGIVNTSLTYLVVATDSYGNLVGGVTIDWAVALGSGSIYPSRSVTERSDLSLDRPVAIAAHSLGPDEGDHTVTATASGIPDAPRVTFMARAVTARVFVELPADSYECFYYRLCSARPVFDPANVVVPVGRTVGWIWGGTDKHNVIFEDNLAEPVSSPTQQTGRHFRTFTKPGTYRYRCTLHSSSFTEGMVGTVTVQ
jgi:hypothetical protein